MKKHLTAEEGAILIGNNTRGGKYRVRPAVGHTTNTTIRMSATDETVVLERVENDRIIRRHVSLDTLVILAKAELNFMGESA